MARPTQITVDGNLLDVVEHDFEIAREDWNEYRLLDGGRVRVRTTVAKIFRVLDSQGKPEYTPEGDPHLIVRHRTEVIASE